ncbi:helix-turn-helix transcriptional regulator [candidate division WOR-3 bacterium]|nr:helix-turn-helix transcriptional regulator [candidate division WOR-3 bacterium]
MTGHVTNATSQGTTLLLPLLGSAVRAQALLYLSVHREAYPRELAAELGYGLRAVQSALERLEAARVVFSRLRGPYRVYALNPLHPLRGHLGGLLGRVVELMPAEERRQLLSPGRRRSRT